MISSRRTKDPADAVEEPEAVVVADAVVVVEVVAVEAADKFADAPAAVQGQVHRLTVNNRMEELAVVQGQGLLVGVGDAVVLEAAQEGEGLVLHRDVVEAGADL